MFFYLDFRSHFFDAIGPYCFIVLYKILLSSKLIDKSSSWSPKRPQKPSKQTPTEFLVWWRHYIADKQEICTYIEDITRWREDMNFMFSWQEHKIHIFEPTCNVLFIIWRNQFNKSKRRESWRHWTIRHSQRWHTENTPLGSRMKWRMESTSGLVPSKTLSSI